MAASRKAHFKAKCKAAFNRIFQPSLRYCVTIGFSNSSASEHLYEIKIYNVKFQLKTDGAKILVDTAVITDELITLLTTIFAASVFN